jgi:hypothetical protein
VSLIEQFEFDIRRCQDVSDEDTKLLRRAMSSHLDVRSALNSLADACLVKLQRNSSLPYHSFSLHRAVCEWCVETVSLEKKHWIIEAAHGLDVTILRPNERYFNTSKL